MTALQRRVNLAAVVIPFLAFLTAAVLLWDDFIGWTDIAILVALYLPAGFGITIGYHRMLTHQAFQTSKPVRYLFAILGSTAVQGPVIEWVADHRKHHAHTDEEGDPHSPHTHAGEGWRGAFEGLWHAHVGWLWKTQGQASRRKYAPDLMEDGGMRWINRKFLWWVLLPLFIAFGAGYALTGELKGALTALLWGGFVRIFFLHHVTWSINSICHFFGTRRFETDDHSTNVFWLALPSLGESWHHNHHAFPRSARQGLARFELDPSAWIITGMEKLGLVWNVVRITPERQAQKLAGAAAVAEEPPAAKAA
ncbi:MAG TPA: acyl-CoA desaturase [Solirubrobacteraceae bacterium]